MDENRPHEYNPEVGKGDLEASIVDYVNRAYRNDDEAKRRLAAVWEENIRFFVGDQMIAYDQFKNTMERIPLPQNSGPRPIANRYSPSIMNIVSDLTRTEPGATVLADSNTPEASLRAKLAEKLRYQMWEDQDESIIYIILATWLALAGTAMKEDVWDSEVQDVVTSVYGPLNIGIPTYANELFNEFNAPWIAKWTIQPVDWVQDTYNRDEEGYYPQNVQYVQAETLSGCLATYSRLRHSVPRLGSLFHGSDVGKGDFVVLKELYLRPNLYFPQGRYYVVASDKLLFASDSPYFIKIGQRTMWNPFTLFRYMFTLGRFWGQCPGDDLVFLQRKINAIDTAVSIIRRKMSAPQWLIPNQCNVANNVISGNAGQVIRYDARMGLKPEKQEASIVPPHFWQEREKAEQEMALISGDVDILRAHQPRGARGVQALQLMTEIVSSRRAPTVKLWEKAIAKSEQKKLLVYRTFAQSANMQRLAPYADEFGEDFIQSFFGDQVPITLRIEAGSTLPKLMASQQQQLLAAFKMGLLGDPQDPMVRKEVTQRIGIIDVQTSWEVDVRKAQLENAAIMRGQFDQVDFLPFDNHGVEFAIHTMAVKQPGFKSMPPEVMQFMMQHIAQHQMVLMQMQMAQAVQAEPKQPNPDKEAPVDTNEGGQG